MTQSDIALSTLCLNSVPFLVMGITHCIGHPFLVEVRQYWWLLLSRQPTLLTRANDLSTDCSWSGGITFFTCVRCKFMCESIKSQFFRGIWLLRLVKLRDCNTCFYPLSRGWRSVYPLPFMSTDWAAINLSVPFVCVHKWQLKFSIIVGFNEFLLSSWKLPSSVELWIFCSLHAFLLSAQCCGSQHMWPQG